MILEPAPRAFAMSPTPTAKACESASDHAHTGWDLENLHSCWTSGACQSVKARSSCLEPVFKQRDTCSSRKCA